MLKTLLKLFKDNIDSIDQDELETIKGAILGRLKFEAVRKNYKAFDIIEKNIVEQCEEEEDNLTILGSELYATISYAAIMASDHQHLVIVTKYDDDEALENRVGVVVELSEEDIPLIVIPDGDILSHMVGHDCSWVQYVGDTPPGELVPEHELVEALKEIHLDDEPSQYN